jgi:hypothetical protein
MEQAQTETQSGKFHQRICFIYQAFVDNLHHGFCRPSSQQQQLYQNERVVMSHSSLNDRDYIPKAALEVCKYYMIS